MSDSGRPATTNGNSSPGQDSKVGTRKRLPKLRDQVRQTDIPTLAQPVAAPALDEQIPTLEETSSKFEQAIPVVDRNG